MSRKKRPTDDDERRQLQSTLGEMIESAPTEELKAYLRAIKGTKARWDDTQREAVKFLTEWAKLGTKRYAEKWEKSPDDVKRDARRRIRQLAKRHGVIWATPSQMEFVAAELAMWSSRKRRRRKKPPSSGEDNPDCPSLGP